MRSAVLADWLRWLERLHPRAIDLGLERVATVARALGVDRPDVPVITVAGTNGKGSVCAMLEAILAADGARVGVYTSPHLLRFNERVRIAGAEVGDDALCTAFERVERARARVSLTYFEFATLAALDLFARTGVHYLVLEVGLGGRLDATNMVDPDVAIVTSIGLDHAEWLGGDVDAVGREKAGIARPGRPLVCGEAAPPRGLLEAAAAIGARVLRPGAGFDYTPAHGGTWSWQGQGAAWRDLPSPALEGGYQVGNAATALAALVAAGCRPARGALEAGLRGARVPGRFEVRPGAVETVLDVAHNPAAAAVLAAALAARPCRGRTLAVLAMYADKDAAGVVAALAPVVDAWLTAGLPGPRGRPAGHLEAIVTAAGASVAHSAADPLAAYRRARELARPGDRVVVAGSFATVAAIDGRPPAAA